ncbi:MAG: glycoside hydrolase family 2 protein [Puniceicoccaceae bacterium]
MPLQTTARQVLNLNPDWRFEKSDPGDAHEPGFDDSTWQQVSLPHTWNDTDTFNNFGKGGHQGESDLWTGVAWYRKTFSLPESDQGKRVYIEFEGVRQIAEIFFNGHRLGINKTGFIPFGFDLTPYFNFGGSNVLAVRADNRFDPHFKGNTPWHHPNWHPPHGGIYRNVRLHVTNPIHVTLPLYSNLQTEGIYARATTITAENASILVTAEIENSLPASTSADLRFSLVDRGGQSVASASKSVQLTSNERAKATTELVVKDPHLWEPDYPYIYEVRIDVVVDGVIQDTATSPFGIRNFRWDTHTGFWINGRPLKLHGWGHKPTQAWAGLGAALPDWLSDFTLRMMEEAGGNMIRWGHSAGSASALHSGDKYGFVTIMPGVDGERDCFGEAWETRKAAFRDTIIYFRNHPSICVWEGGNYNISVPHTKELREVVDQWDPDGKRYFGFRMSSPGMLPYIDLELGTVGRVRAHPHLPVVETEYDRTETPRRVWDKYSPPDYGNLGELAELNTYHLDSEGFAVNAIKEWWTLFGAKPDHSGGANWIFSDGPHGTRQRTDAARATGEVDGVRLPKEAYWALQATWADEPRVHLIGHWTYAEGIVKTMYAVARADSAELFVNGRSLGLGERSLDTLFTWPEVAFEPGNIRVVAYLDGEAVAEQVKETAGEAVALRMTPILAPGGWRADGSDIALIDVEVVDKEGRRCPTDQARVDFSIAGPAIWRGSYNSGKEYSTNHLYFDTECGINRASLRSTLEAGIVTITATREGLEPTTLVLESLPVELHHGMLLQAPANFDFAIGPRPPVDTDALTELAAARELPTPKATVATDDNRHFSTFAYTGDGAGGVEERLYVKALAYSDDALLYIDAIPPSLEGARLIRTANRDRAYWANDYIVATAGKALDLFVAHDANLERPGWLSDYQPTGEAVPVNGRPMTLFVRRMEKDEDLRISGNADQGVPTGDALNFILFSRALTE